MNSEDTKRRREEYQTKLEQQKEKIERILYKKAGPPSSHPSPDLSLSNSNVEISNLISPKSILSYPATHQPQKPSSFHPTIHVPPPLNVQDNKIICDIDSILTRLNKQGPSLPVSAIKRTLNLNQQYKAPDDLKPRQAINLKEFEKDLQSIKKSSDVLVRTLQENQNSDSPIGYSNILDIKKKSLDYNSSVSNNTEYLIHNYEQGELSEPQQEQQEDGYYEQQGSHLDLNQFQQNPSQLSYLPPLPPKPSQVQKQVMKQTLLKYREAVSEWSGKKGEDQDESLMFDLSRSMSEIVDVGKERDERLERLYEEREQVLEELESVQEQLRRLERQLGD